MVVRFLPPPDEAAAAPVHDRGDLAEVIELRSRLVRPERGEPDADAETGAEHGAGAETVELPDQAPVVEPGSAGGAAFESEPDRPARTVSEDAIRLLARRARSSGELRRELSAAGHDASDVEATVLECESSLYLDDLGLARVLTEGLRERKRASRSQIRMKLRERLLPDGVIEQALGELDDDEEHELLRQAARDRARKMSGLDRQTAERRLLGFLARRGWSGERAVRVAREALENTAARGTVRFR